MILFLPTQTKAQFYAGSQMDFGKNRIQYKDFFWTYYDYSKYQIYFYEGGKDLAGHVALAAQKTIENFEKKLDFPLDEKIQIVLYNKMSDYAQSNLGLATDEPYNTGGVTRIIASKVVIYYEGDHQKLDDQLRAGIAEVFINQMMYGGRLRDMLKNSTLLNLPDWYVNGLVSYLTHNWTVDIDNRVRDGFVTGKYKKFNRLEGIDAIYAGHSIWYYISETYGESVIPNILYMVKVTRNIESSFLFVLGLSMKSIEIEWKDYYLNRYNNSEKGRQNPQQPALLKKIKKQRVYHSLKVSPNGKQAIFATNELSQYKVWLYDIEKQKVKRIMKVGHKINRINDYSYPILTWHPSGKLFSILTEKKGKLILTTYEPETKEKQERRIIDFEKILDISYSDDGTKFAMSAVQKGQTDIYVFTVASNGYDRITNDIYDDVNPRFAHNSKEIIFSSNRNDDTIRFDFRPSEPRILPATKDLFVYNYASRSKVLKRLTETPDINELYPSNYDSAHYSYLSEQNGIRNRYIAHFDSVISYVDTSEHYRFIVRSKPISNYSRNIIEQDVNVKAGKIAEIIFIDGKYRMYVSPITPPSLATTTELPKTAYSSTNATSNQKQEATSDTTNKTSRMPEVTISKMEQKRRELKPGEVDINNYTFDTEPVKNKKENKTKVTETTNVNSNNKSIGTDTLTQKPEKQFNIVQQQNYHVSYSTDYVVTQLDNTFLNTSYQKFTGGGGPLYLNPGFTGLIKFGLSDLFEDFKMVAAIRLSGDLNSNEYFFSYQDRLHLLDKELQLHRQSFQNVGNAGASLLSILTHDAKYMLRYPFNEVSALRGTISSRLDQSTYLATDLTNLKKPDEYQIWGGLKLEYIFDNTLKRGLNLYYGTRAKVFGEYFRQIDLEKTNMVVVGFDVRHYQKIHRDFIWTNRLAGSTSFGDQKLIYYMGGVDNWFNAKFDQSINIATNQNYAYQTLATNMRGFFQNIRNGNSFLVLNSELRMPIFRYLLNRPIRSDFINNFQIIGFADVGTAWTGPSPYSEENSLNKITIAKKGSPITIILNNNKEPIIAGYGWGLRSRIFGYFVRADWAWGIEDGVILPREFYLSFSLDF